MPKKQPDTVNCCGKLLLAAPRLRGGVFERSVIFITEHSKDEGAMGFILNAPLGPLVGEATTEAEELEGLESLPIYLGGPVAKDQLVLASLSHKGSHIRFSQRIIADDARALLDSENTLLRAYAGYSGWSPGQLEMELEANTWIIAPPTIDLVTEPHNHHLWKHLMCKLSAHHAVLSEMPDKPYLN